jgi:hypothetical protein
MSSRHKALHKAQSTRSPLKGEDTLCVQQLVHLVRTLCGYFVHER